VPLVGHPLALVDPVAIGDEHSEAFSLLGFEIDLALVDGIFVSLDAEVLLESELIVLENVRNHVVA
jgi:hypothetical protein